jgi:asparagine synthase (glutamine-hydrolysing)
LPFIFSSNALEKPASHILEKTFRFGTVCIYCSEETDIFEIDNEICLFSGTIFNLEELNSKYRLDQFSKPLLLFQKNQKADYEQFLNEIDGDFVFINFDIKSNKITIVRDHFGAQKCFYAFNENSFCVASSLHLFSGNLKVNPEAILSYFDFQNNDAPINDITFYEGIYELLPAHTLQKNLKGETSQKMYWKPNLAKYQGLSEDEIISAFKKALSNSVTKRLKNSKLIASNLSGGLDSSSVSSLAKLAGCEVNSIYFDANIPETDESFFANKVVEKHNLKHHVIQHSLSQLELAKKIIESTGKPDELFLTGTSFVSIAQFLKENNISTILTGEGGDAVVGYGFEYLNEAFENKDWPKLKNAIAGYVHERNLKIYFQEWDKLDEEQKLAKYEAHFFEKILIQKLKKGAVYEVFKIYLEAKKHFNISLESLGSKIFFGLIYKFKKKKSEYKLLRTFPQNVDKNHQVFDSSKAGLSNSQKINFDFSFASLNYAAAQEQAAIYEAFGIAGFHPFYDKNLLEISLAVPLETKFDGGNLRGTLRKATQDILPEEVRLRTSKAAFTALALQQSKELLKQSENLFSPTHQLWTYIDPEEFNNLRQQILTAPDDCKTLNVQTFLANRVVFLGLFLDYLEERNTAIIPNY